MSEADPVVVALHAFAALVDARRSYLEDDVDRALEHVAEAARDTAKAYQLTKDKGALV